MEFENLKKIPHSLEAERALIGGIFYNQDLFDEIRDIVKAEDFYKVEHSVIYEAIEKVYSENKGIDGILIEEEIKKSNSKNKEEILEILKDEKDVNLVAIDEVQFFDEGIIDVVEELVDKGIRVAMSGLDLDFRGEPFDITAKLLAKSEFITKLQAVCMKCGKPATRSQRIVNGKPASIDSEIIQIGEKESYEPRCRRCHEVGKKK